MAGDLLGGWALAYSLNTGIGDPDDGLGGHLFFPDEEGLFNGIYQQLPAALACHLADPGEAHGELAIWVNDYRNPCMPWLEFSQQRFLEGINRVLGPHVSVIWIGAVAELLAGDSQHARMVRQAWSFRGDPPGFHLESRRADGPIGPSERRAFIQFLTDWASPDDFRMRRNPPSR